MASEANELVPVVDEATLREDGRTVVSADGQSIALFVHEGEIYAVDNRCPHMGFPLSKGSVEEGILTCHWHHARFELAEGDTFDPWADDVQTYPIELEDGEVYVDPNPPLDVSPQTHWRNRLADGLNENIDLVMAKAVVGLDDLNDGFKTPLETTVNFGTRYRANGWGSGLTTLGCVANLYADLPEEDRRRAMFLGIRAVADDCADEPPRFQGYAFENNSLPKHRLKSWFRESVEVRDTDGAERCLLTAVNALEPQAVAEIVFTAATDSLYLNSGHTLDFLNKAFTILDHIGWHGTGAASKEGQSNAAPVLAATVERLTEATRAEELSEWRKPVDLAGLVFDVHDRLDDLVAAGADRTWHEPEDFVETLLSDDPETVIDALVTAIRQGATQRELADAVTKAATRRVAYFATSNEFADWNTVHHTFSYANAVYEATGRTNAVELYRGALDAAASVYLDRFLNQPRAPLPEPDTSDREPGVIRDELMECFDEQGEVNRAARLVNEHHDAGGDPEALRETLGHALVREDAGFHTVQNVEGHFARHSALDDEWERRLALMAPARYMAAHFPTRREAEQTFSIASRLHRGEKIHEK